MNTIEPTFRNASFELRLDPDIGIAHLQLASERGVNRIGPTFSADLEEALRTALAQPSPKGIILGTAHRDFCVGADLRMITADADARAALEAARHLGRALRGLETCGVPVVAALGGSALGGGFEIALACHHRVALDNPAIRLGFPEVALGLLTGAGGTSRMSRRIGWAAALEQILQAQLNLPAEAQALGLVDEVATSIEEVLARAQAWILANPGARQPWDRPGFVFPPPSPQSEEGRGMFLVAEAMLYKKTAGAYPAAEAAMRVVQEGAGLAFDAAVEVEARAFARLATSGQAHDMIRTFFFHKEAADHLEGLPHVKDAGFRKVGVLGAGMMGAGLAWLCARHGFDVVLRDVSTAALDKARAHAEEEARRSRRLSAEERTLALARIHTTLEAGDLDGCDLAIEAVFEDLDLKHRVIREVEPRLASGGVFASNTSALPVTDLAQASAQPERFVGLHFFSPVERMPLVELIRGKDTSDETVGRCLAFSRAIGKTPICVNDGFGFYTTRVFSAYILEGAQLVAEGHDPALVEWAASSAGMAVPPLQVFDEISLRLAKHVLAGSEHHTPGRFGVEGTRLVLRMVDDLDRPGRAEGRGFYEYTAGKRTTLWPGLADLASGHPAQTGVDLLRKRLLLVQVAEVARAIDDGVIVRLRDADLGAVLGLGFAPNTGGPLAYMDRRGLSTVVAELDELAWELGGRFEPAAGLRERAARGERFYG